MTFARHLLQYVHGLSARSWPRAKMCTRSLLAIRGRAIETMSQSPRSIAAAITDAVWKPPVQITGTLTAALIFRALARLAPSIPSGLGAASFHWRRARSGKLRNRL